jgi:uncharacterized protein
MRSPEAVGAMLCPLCKVGLSMSDRQGVEIDYCPQCRGVWLDRGELDKIIERSAAAEAPAAPPPQQGYAPPPPQQPYLPQQQGHSPWGGHGGYDPRYGKHKRKKSFFEELFD